MDKVILCSVNSSEFGIYFLQEIISNVNTYVIPGVSFICLVLNITNLIILKCSFKKRFYQYVFCLNITENFISLLGVFYIKKFSPYKDVYDRNYETLLASYYIALASRVLQLVNVFCIIFLNLNRLQALSSTKESLFNDIKAKFIMAAFMLISLLLYGPAIYVVPMEYIINDEVVFYLKPTSLLLTFYYIILIFFEFIIPNTFLLYLMFKLKRKFKFYLKKFSRNKFRKKDINYTRLTINFSNICLINRFQDSFVTVFFRITLINYVSICTLFGTMTVLVRAFSNLFIYTSLISTSIIMFSIDKNLKKKVLKSKSKSLSSPN